jgi:hypothetical protein
MALKARTAGLMFGPLPAAEEQSPAGAMKLRWAWANLSPRSQEDFDNAVSLVAKFLVHLRSVFKTGGICHDETGINIARFDPRQKRLRVRLHAFGQF